MYLWAGIFVSLFRQPINNIMLVMASQLQQLNEITFLSVDAVQAMTKPQNDIGEMLSLAHSEHK